MITMHLLEPEEAARWESMTFPIYRRLLNLEPTYRHPEEAEPRHIRPLAVGAEKEDGPAGLALVELPLEEGEIPELLSIFVRPQYRGKGIATDLLTRAAEEIAARGFARMRAVYMTGKPAIPILERVFEKCGWDAPATRTVTVRFAMERLMEAPWLSRYRLGEEYDIFPWIELRAEERRELMDSQAKLHWIADDLQPWDYEKAGVESRTSVGVRYRGKVVGWVLNHELTPKTIRYTCSYIHKSLGRLGRILPVYTESFRRSREAGYEEGMFVTPLYHRGMAAFAKRWFAPWSDFVGETKGITKELTSRGKGALE